jgi:hypothetical protein
MKKVFGFVLVCFSVVGIVVLGIRELPVASEVHAQAVTLAPEAAQVVQATPALQETGVPKETPAPAVDYAATEAALSGAVAQAEKTRQALDAQIETSKAAAANAELEAERERTRQKQMEVDARATSEANALAAAEIEITRQADSNRAAEIGIRAKEAENEARRLEVEAARLEQSRVNSWAAWVAVALLSIGLAYFGWALARNRPAIVQPAAVPNEHEPEDDGGAQAPAGYLPITPQQSHPDYTPVAPQVFAVWAYKMLEGAAAGINGWETSDSPFGRDEYRPFLTWAEKRGYIEVKGGAKVLSEKGRAFCAAWLARFVSPSPLAGEVDD